MGGDGGNSFFSNQDERVDEECDDDKPGQQIFENGCVRDHDRWNTSEVHSKHLKHEWI